MTEEKNIFDDIKDDANNQASTPDETVKTAVIEEDDEPSRPLSYYREMKKTQPEQEEASPAIITEDDEEEISRPLSWYKEQRSAAEKAAQQAAAPENEETKPVISDDDEEPSRPLSYYKEQKAAAEKAALQQKAAEASLPASTAQEQIAETTQSTAEIKAAHSKKQPLFPVKGKPLGVQSIAEGAVLAALGVIIGFVSWNIPFLAIVAQLVFPLPMAVYTMRRGLAAGLSGTLVTGILLALIINPVSALLLIIQSCIVGIFFGYCRKLDKKPLFTLAGGTVIASLGYAAAIILSVFISGIGWEYIWQIVDEMMLAYEEVLKGMGFYESLSAQGIDPNLYMQQLTNTMNTLLPGALIISTMLATCASYWLFGKIVVALGYEHKPLPPFAEWRLSWHFVWGIIIGGFLMFFGYTKESQILYNIGTNILYVFAPLLLTTAAAVISGIKRAKGWSGMMTVMIWFFILAMMPISLYALILIGVFDPLIDFRAKFARSKE